MFKYQTFLVPIVDETKKDQLSVKTTKDVVIVEVIENKKEKIVFLNLILQQDEEMRSQVLPVDDDMGQYWETDITSENIDTVSL